MLTVGSSPLKDPQPQAPLFTSAESGSTETAGHTSMNSSRHPHASMLVLRLGLGLGVRLGLRFGLVRLGERRLSVSSQTRPLAPASCPVAAFRFNQSAAEAWFTHEWSNAALESEDIGTIVIGILLLVASAVVLLWGEALVKPVFFLVGGVGALVPAFAAVDAILAALNVSPTLDCVLLIAIPIAIAIAAGVLLC